MTQIDWKKDREESEAMCRETAAHQIATFGHVVTQEELDADEAEWKEERRRKFEGLTEDEAIVLRQRERDDLRKELTEKYGVEDEDEDEDEDGLSDAERERRMERNKLAYAKAFHDAAEEGKARREALKQSQVV
jgi:hypothetical protein